MFSQLQDLLGERSHLDSNPDEDTAQAEVKETIHVTRDSQSSDKDNPDNTAAKE